MDPLSVTLAVISLTTAVKDLVELGQKIHKSFAKASNNLRNAKRAAEDIKEMVEEIEVFCEDHKDALGNMKDFRLALEGLLAKFRTFETSILPLLPQAGGRRRDRFFRGWDAWRNNNKIEGSIFNLQSDIVKVIRRYMLKSAMRTEVKLETVHQETRTGLSGITQGLEVLEAVQRDVSAIRMTTAGITATHSSYKSSANTSDEFNRHVIMFAQSTPSTSAPILRTPDVITEELMTTAYIKLQINTIAIAVEKISTLPVSAPNIIKKFRLSSELELASKSIMHLRHHIVRQVTSIRDLLDTGSIHTISMQDGASALYNLSNGLKILCMGHESMLVSNWATTLLRTLTDASRNEQPDLAARLAMYLRNQSLQYNCSGDKIQGLPIIEEAYTITQNLRNQYGGRVHFQILYSSILLSYAKLVENRRSIEMSIEAVQVLEVVLEVQAFTQSKSPEKIEWVVEPSSLFLDRLFSSAPPITAIIDYALGLQRLGIYLFRDGLPQCALKLALLAIAVRRKMVSLHGREHRVGLANALRSLVRGRIASHVPKEELVDMADECIQLFRELAEKNPLFYARRLVDVLWRKAETLESLQQDSAAIETWEEVASLAEQIVQDSEMCASALGHLSDQFRRLERHEDAVRTGTLAITTYQHGAETQAQRYFYLSQDLQRLHRYKESVEAARKSVTQCQHLAMKDSRRWISNLTGGLSDLAHCLAASGNHSEALIAWGESVSMLHNFVNTDPNASSADIGNYLFALDAHRQISVILEDDEKCLAVCSTAVQYLRQLLELYPLDADAKLDLLSTEFYYAYNLLRVGRLQDAEQYINHWLDVWSNKPSTIPEPEIESWHAAMVTLKADALDSQGRTAQALLTTQKVQDIVRMSVGDYQPSFDEMIKSMVQEARLQVDLGHTEEALRVAEGALRLSRDNKPKPTLNSLVWSLYAVAFTTLSSGSYKRAVKVAQKGRDICAYPKLNWESNAGEHGIFIHPRLFAILSSAEANLGRCNTALEYAHRAVGMSLDIGNMKSHISATTAERSYMETRGNLAEILLATGDLAQARQICQERSAYFAKRVEKRMGDYRELAPILRMLSILCCGEGRHMEGETAAEELSRIMRMLGSAFPSLKEQVKIRLHNQAKIPILKVLNDICQKLSCGHQTEDVSLSSISSVKRGSEFQKTPLCGATQHCIAFP